MKEMIERLTAAGLSAEQAQTAIETIAGFVKEKFPMLSGAVDNIFNSDITSASGDTGTGFGTLSGF